MKRISFSLLLIAVLAFLSSCDSGPNANDLAGGDPGPGTGHHPPSQTLRLVGYFDSVHQGNFNAETFGQCRLRWPDGSMSLTSATVSVGRGDSLQFSFEGRAFDPEQGLYSVRHSLDILRDPNHVMSAAHLGNEQDWFVLAGADPTRPDVIALIDASPWHRGFDLNEQNCQGLVFGDTPSWPAIAFPRSWVEKTFVLKNLRFEGEDTPIESLSAGNRYSHFRLTGARLELNLDGSYRLTHQSDRWGSTSGWYVKEETIEGIYRMDQDAMIVDLTADNPSFGRVSSDTLLVIQQRGWFLLDQFDFVFVEE